jgi:hypothetical protein
MSLDSLWVQIELQQDGHLWKVQGCTAYGSNGMQKPLPLIAQDFGSGRAAIRAMKQHARKHLCLDDCEAQTDIRWQLILWFAPLPSMTCKPRRQDTGHLAAEPYDTAALVNTA